MAPGWVRLERGQGLGLRLYAKHAQRGIEYRFAFARERNFLVGRNIKWATIFILSTFGFGSLRAPRLASRRLVRDDIDPAGAKNTILLTR